LNIKFNIPFKLKEKGNSIMKREKKDVISIKKSEEILDQYILFFANMRKYDSVVKTNI